MLAAQILDRHAGEGRPQEAYDLLSANRYFIVRPFRLGRNLNQIATQFGEDVKVDVSASTTTPAGRPHSALDDQTPEDLCPPLGGGSAAYAASP